MSPLFSLLPPSRRELGKIFVEFQTGSSAAKAVAALHGRDFGDSKVKAAISSRLDINGL
jgi:hypothetical protein